MSAASEEQSVEGWSGPVVPHTAKQKGGLKPLKFSL
jgi:hypothetical protein